MQPRKLFHFIITGLLAALTAIAWSMPAKAAETTASPKEMQALVEEAYIYGLPIIMSYKTMYFYAVDDKNPQFKAPFNQINNIARVYGPKDTAVVSPNSDTPYSVLWLDLRVEPVVLCVPTIDKKRYFSVMLQDLSTYLLPYIGSRATGNDGGCFMVAGPDWQGDKPDGIEQVMQSKTDFLFAAYRTQLFNPKDLDKVKEIQSNYKVQTLSGYFGKDAPAPTEKIDFIAWDEKAATGNNFIAYLNFLVQFVKPDAKEKVLREKLAPIGIGPGKPFDYAKLPSDQQQAFAEGVKSAIAKIKEKAKTTPVAGHSQRDYDHDWLKRAVVTQVGWGANDPREASYPVYRTDADDDELDASKHSYTLTFAKDAFPPVKSFWSVTMYDGKTQLMIENPLNRYLINSPMLPNLKKNADGSLTLYVQKESPGKDKESNWLPAPEGPFYMLLRLYWPSEEILNGNWKQPAMQKAK